MRLNLKAADIDIKNTDSGASNKDVGIMAYGIEDNHQQTQAAS